MKEEVKSEEEVIADVIDDGSSLIPEAMANEEEKLLEARIKEEEAQRDEAIDLNETQFNKLDELLTQTKLYSEFLLEKMDDITLVYYLPLVFILSSIYFYVYWFPVVCIFLIIYTFVHSS